LVLRPSERGRSSWTGADRLATTTSRPFCLRAKEAIGEAACNVRPLEASRRLLRAAARPWGLSADT